ncbi:MAG: hypothetical protein RLY93_01155 [Sumerlaeia bacterium]
MMNRQNPNPNLKKAQLDPPTGPPPLRPLGAVPALHGGVLPHDGSDRRGHPVLAVLAFGAVVILTLGGALAVALLQP